MKLKSFGKNPKEDLFKNEKYTIASLILLVTFWVLFFVSLVLLLDLINNFSKSKTVTVAILITINLPIGASGGVYSIIFCIINIKMCKNDYSELNKKLRLSSAIIGLIPGFAPISLIIYSYLLYKLVKQNKKLSTI